jgi:hypothetical protein
MLGPVADGTGGTVEDPTRLRRRFTTTRRPSSHHSRWIFLTQRWRGPPVMGSRAPARLVNRIDPQRPLMQNWIETLGEETCLCEGAR